MKPFLIVGIDPGTTLAYAILDLDGNVIKVKSSKSLNIDSLTANIFYFGKPLIVATDVIPVPKLVEKFASQTGSKIIGPKQNFKVFQKKELTKHYGFKNDHERDALAAAIFAFKKIRALLKKIDLYVSKYNKEDLKKDISYLVLSKNLSISDAVFSLEKKEKKPIVKKPKLRTESIKVKFDEVKYFKNQNEKLKNKIKHLENKFKKLNIHINRLSDKKVRDLIGFRERKINFLNKEIEDYKIEIKKLNKKILSLNDWLFRIDGFLVVPRFSNLSFDEIQGKKLKDVIFVENPGIFSERALKFMKGKVGVIIHSQPASKSILSRFIFINAQKLAAIVKDKFVFVEKAKLDEEKNKFDILSKVVKEYKKERE